MANQLLSSRAAASRRISSLVVLSAGFSFTGASTVMLGALLPGFSARWLLRDDTAGLLLFLQFLGSALGAVLTSRHRRRTLLGGYGLLAASSAVLALAGPRPPYAAIFFWGLGLGLAMTSTSLLFSDRWSDDRAAKLEWLNFAWSAGATLGPVVFLPWVQGRNISTLFLALCGISLSLLAWVSFGEPPAPTVKPLGNLVPHRATGGRGGFFELIILAMCTVGVETALSGWLTTYSHRAGLRSLAGAAVATSLFWLGGMAGRLAFSTRLLEKVGRQATLRGAMWAVAITLPVLLEARSPSIILVIAVILGLSVGPLYPLLLSFLLEQTSRGWIFAVGGIGAAFFPWLTGLLSAHFHSLRVGLIAPCAAGFTMLVLQAVALGRPKIPSTPAPVHS
jgi:MFS transporter, FHS family, glucose/mannose:H+ symporter